MRIFLLEDDERRCNWFAKHFKGDHLDAVCEIDEAKELLKTRTYDSIFLDHDRSLSITARPVTTTSGRVMRSHTSRSHPELQRAATIMVHSLNSDGAMRMVEELRAAGATLTTFHSFLRRQAQESPGEITPASEGLRVSAARKRIG